MDYGSQHSERLRKWMADLMQTQAANPKVARVLAAIDTLPDNLKEVIVLGIFQDKSYSEMEVLTGVTATLLRSRMVDGLKRAARIIGFENSN